MSYSRKAILFTTLITLACMAPDGNGLVAQRAEALPRTFHRWREHSVTYQPEEGNLCAGGSTILLLELPGDPAAQDRINTIILEEVNTALHNDSAYIIPASAFYAAKHYLGDSALYNWNTKATLLTDSNGLASFQLVTGSNCGWSTHDPDVYAYFTVDLTTGARVGFGEVFDTLRMTRLGKRVQAYAREHRVDNIQYIGEHDQSKLVYLEKLDRRFYLTPKSIVLYLRVRDDNEPDSGHRASEEETMGELWMPVEVPKERMKDFVKGAYGKRVL
jgi:hypothetical protein